MTQEPEANTIDTEFCLDFLDRLDELNRAVASTRERVEGNYFYRHEDPLFPEVAIHFATREKRFNLMHVTQSVNSVLEIGFNAGHSALLMLFHNSTLSYHGIDLGQYKYTQVAADLLGEWFPGRFQLTVGDSVHVMPQLAVTEPGRKYDLIHVDGNHNKPYVETDFYNATRLLKKHGLVMFDDVARKPYIGECVRAFIDAGLAQRELLPIAKSGCALLRVG